VGSQLRLIDSHCHIGSHTDDDVEIMLQTAAAEGVTEMVLVGTDQPTSLAALALAVDHPELKASIGLHPHDASEGTGWIESLAAEHAFVAVGECGLDYHYDHSPRDVQRDAFADQIAIAHRQKLPLIIHSREAWDDTFAILDSEGLPDQTIFHCFTGGEPEAEKALERGAFISFSGIVTFKNAADVRAAAARCPLDRLLIETDSPYLAPVPHRGQANQPAFLPAVAQGVADAKDLSVAEIARVSVANAESIFGSWSQA